MSLKNFKQPAHANAPAAPTEAPKDTDHKSNVWFLLSATPRPKRDVPFPRNLPGTDEPIAMIPMWPLTQGELLEANARADEHLKSLFKDGSKKDEMNLAYSHSFANEIAVQQLWLACRDPDDVSKPAFPSPKTMRMNLTGDEVGVLYNHYLTIQAELGPITARLSDEEYEALVRRIAEGGNADPIDSLSSDLLRSLVLSMASHLNGFWIAKSSAGSSPENDTLTPSDESTNDKPPSTSSDGAVDASE